MSLLQHENLLPLLYAGREESEGKERKKERKK